MRIISTTDELADFTRELSRSPFVAVDTEFMREKTYWPILCLVQAAGPEGEAIIDPLADGMDLSPLLDLMKDKTTTKVFHAARQDVEIFYKLLGEVPAPLFDTQIAAMACGFGDQIGYEPLMRTLLNAQIDKGSRFTDWSRRPLSKAQLSYAMSDVTYLREAYPLLSARLDDQNRRHWVEEEMEGLLDAGLYFVNPVEAWRRMKLKNVRASDIGVLMKLAEWREKEAQSRDIPRNRILKDDAIFELSRLRPTAPAELAKARTMPNGFERSRAATDIITAVEAGLAVPKSDLPKNDHGRRRETPPADLVDLLKVLLKNRCERMDVAPKLIASVAEIEAIALGDTENIKAMHGWRREVFGAQAEQLMRGEIAMRYANGRVELIDQN